MAVRLTCECGKRLVAEENYRGKRVKCPACGRLIVLVPSAPQLESVRVQVKPNRQSGRKKSRALRTVLLSVGLVATVVAVSILTFTVWEVDDRNNEPPLAEGNVTSRTPQLPPDAVRIFLELDALQHRTLAEIESDEEGWITDFKWSETPGGHRPETLVPKERTEELESILSEFVESHFPSSRFVDTKTAADLTLSIEYRVSRGNNVIAGSPEKHVGPGLSMYCELRDSDDNLIAKCDEDGAWFCGCWLIGGRLYPNGASNTAPATKLSDLPEFLEKGSSAKLKNLKVRRAGQEVDVSCTEWFDTRPIAEQKGVVYLEFAHHRVYSVNGSELLPPGILHRLRSELRTQLKENGWRLADRRDNCDVEITVRSSDRFPKRYDITTTGDRAYTLQVSIAALHHLGNETTEIFDETQSCRSPASYQGASLSTIMTNSWLEQHWNKGLSERLVSAVNQTVD